MKQDSTKAGSYFAGLALFLCVTTCWATQNEMTLRQKARQAAMGLSGKVSDAEIETLLDNLTGSNSLLARTAVRRFAELGAVKLVALGLEYSASSVQIEAAKRLKGLKEAKGTEITLMAVRALEKANKDLLFGGSEVSNANKEFKNLLIDLICDAIGLDRRSVSSDDHVSVQMLIDTAYQSLDAGK